MFDANVELFYNNTHTFTSIDKLSKNKRVLFCSLVRHMEQSTFEYIRDMIRWQKTLDAYDVTLYFLTSQPIQVANITANQQGIPELVDAKIILDRNHIFYNQLKIHTAKKQTARHLARTWLFHALVKNGKILHLQAQPTENQKEYALNNIKPHQFNDIIKYKKQKTFNEIRQLDNNLIYNQPCLFEFGDQDLTIVNIFYYQGLWPNTNLIEYLDSQVQ